MSLLRPSSISTGLLRNSSSRLTLGRMSLSQIHPHPDFKLRDPSLLSSTGWINNANYDSHSKSQYELVDPGSGKPWHRIADMTESETDIAIAAAEKAFKGFSAIPGRIRGKMILELDRLWMENKNDLAQIAVLECGKTLAEGEGEVVVGSQYAWVMAGEAERNTGETIKGAETPGMRYFTIKEPVGPVALLAPWNFPLMLPYRKLVSALAAGCTVVMKPSPETAASTVAMGILAARAGFPEGVVNVVTGSTANTPGIGRKICEDKRVKKLHFTGSTEVGKLLAKQCASTLKKLTLELGGNGAYIVYEDADLEKAASMLVANKFRNAGQVCVTANRVYVQKGVHDKFASLVRTEIEKLKIGHGMDAGITLGSVATQRGVERAAKLVEDAKSHGGEVVTGGKRWGEGWHFEPTLLVGTGHDAMVHRGEMFSPILSIYAFDTEEEVTALANDTDFGLTNYVWTKDISRAWRSFEALKSGQVAINNGNASAAEMPFGGISDSGMGKEGGFGYGIQEFCNTRTAALLL